MNNMDARSGRNVNERVIKGTSLLKHFIFRGFIKVFNRRATEFNTRAKNWQGPEGLDF